MLELETIQWTMDNGICTLEQLTSENMHDQIGRPKNGEFLRNFIRRRGEFRQNGKQALEIQ